MTKRKDMLPSELASLGAALQGIEAEAARERQRLHGGTAPGRAANTSGPGTGSVVQTETRDIVGAALGMSGSTYQRLHNAHGMRRFTGEQHTAVEGEVYVAWLDGFDAGVRAASAAMDAAIDEALGGPNSYHLEPVPLTAKQTVQRLVGAMTSRGRVLARGRDDDRGEARRAAGRRAHEQGIAERIRTFEECAARFHAEHGTRPRLVAQ